RGMALGLRRRQNDHGAARPADPPLRHRRDRQRQLALQEPSLTISPRGPNACATLTSSGVRPAPQQSSAGGQYWTPIGGQCSTPIDTSAFFPSSLNKTDQGPR